jgi:class 3 adenylate cyclase
MLKNLRKRFNLQQDIDDLFSSLPVPPPLRFSFDRFPKGIDNTNIDVYLCPQFTSSTRILVRRMLLHDIGENSLGEPHPPPAVRDLESFEKAYTGVMEAGVSKARKESSPEHIQLLHFSILKYILVSVSEELLQHRDRLQHARTINGDHSSGNAVHLHDKLVTLTQQETALRYRVTRKLFRHVYKLESTTLRKLRKSVLGRSWPIPKQVLFNPLLQLPSLWVEDQFMHHYPLALMRKQDPGSFSKVNAIVTEIFDCYLPAWCHAPYFADSVDDVSVLGRDSAGMRLRHDRGMLSGFLETELLLSGALQEDEYAGGLCSWLDDPHSMEKILSFKGPSKHARGRRARQDVSDKSSKDWNALTDHIVHEAHRRFKQAGFTSKILASHEAPKVFRELHGRVPLGLICQYLEGDIPRRKLLQKLSGIKGVTQPDIAKKVLDIAAGRISNMSRARKGYRIKCFLRDFAVLRRDLKLAYQCHCAMNGIKILLRDETIELSRSNNSLQQFVQNPQSDEKTDTIRNHVIIKADVRGSTAITTELLEQRLNPATHFSLNFFQPINKLLENFGATKVFVEGDAIILSITEYEDAPFQWLCVSHACGLARKILQVVDAQNAQNRKHGLPELELGIGVSFNDGSPAFLYDGDKKIMISPAINRADRLSSCAAVLRRTALGDDVKRGVEVVVPVDKGMAVKERSDELLSYNVNGIELDMPAFFKLKAELALLRLGGDVPGYSQQSVFYAGRFPDRTGKMHWLIVREAPVRIWIGNSINTEEEWGRRFYEVITDTNVISLLKERIVGDKASDSMESGVQDFPDDESDSTRYIH